MEYHIDDTFLPFENFECKFPIICNTTRSFPPVQSQRILALCPYSLLQMPYYLLASDITSEFRQKKIIHSLEQIRHNKVRLFLRHPPHRLFLLNAQLRLSMTTRARRPSFASTRRPSSAIFIGGLPQPSPPSPANSSSTHSQLPSPPATTSGSTGDSNSTSPGSVRRAGMPNGDIHPSLSDDEDDNEQDNEGDHTAKLSSDRRDEKGKQLEDNSSSSTLQRVKSLTERNRKVPPRLQHLA